MAGKNVYIFSRKNYNISIKPSYTAMQDKENQQNKKSARKVQQNLPVDRHNTPQINSNDSYSSDSDTDTSKKYFSQKKRRSTSPYGKCKRVPWNETEKRLYWIPLEVISRKKVTIVIRNSRIKKNSIALKRRTAAMIKTWLMNQRQKQKSLKF